MKTIFFKLGLLFFFSTLIFTSRSFGQIKADKNAGCLPLVVIFEIENFDVESVEWQTEDGQSSTAKKPTFIFEKAGEWGVYAVLTLNTGIIDTVQYESLITVNERPLVDFSIENHVSCIGEEILFNNLTTNADSYLWSFGDGNQSTEENPSHQYQASGKYTVSLTAKIDGECQEIKVMENVIEIHEVNKNSFSASSYVQCLSDKEPIIFSFDEEVSHVSWDFGDGTVKNGSYVEYSYSTVGAYKVEVSYINEFGCSISTSLDSLINVGEIESPKMEVSESSICLGEEVTLKALHPSNTGFEWEINGKQYEGKKVSLGFSEIGDIAVKLTYFNDFGCSVSIFDEALLNVQEVEAVEIDYDQTIGCEPFDFVAVNRTPGAVDYAWKVNGETINGVELNYTFDQAGDYNIVAVTHYESGCQIETELVDRVQVFKRETNIKVNEWRGCAPFTPEIALLNENATDIKWTIGEKQLDGENVNYEFKNPGVYFPIVSYTNAKGCKVDYEFETPLIVFDNDIDLAEPEVIESCTYTEVHFSGDMGYDFWEWDFGDGKKSNERYPIHSYSAAGNYQVSLTTNNKNGCRTTIENYNIIEIPDLEVETNMEVTEGEECGFFSVLVVANLEDWQSARWYYNESLISTESELHASFISLGDVGITLSVGSEGECTKSKAIMVPNPWTDCENPELEGDLDEQESDSPIGKFNFSSCNVPYSIDLVNPIPEADKFEWRFKDGTTHSKQDFKQSFHEIGEYTIGYWAKIERDSFVFVEDYITVNIQQSEIDFDYELQKYCEGYEIILNPENTEFENYRWKMNNRPIELSDGGRYWVEKEGLYSISLSASGQNSCATTKIKNVYIGNQENRFSFPNSLCLGEGFTIEHTLIGFNSIKWDMGNGVLIDDFNIPYVFDARGEYQVKAIATDYEGCESIFDLPQQIIVKNPIAEFTANKRSGCGETTIQFQNKSQDAVEWFWDFGNGETSTEENPKVTFIPGSYTVTLTSTNGECSKTSTEAEFIQIDDLTSDFSFEFDQSCLPVTVSFQDQSVNATSWQWDFGDGTTSTDQNPTHIYFEAPKRSVKLIIENENGCKLSIKKPMNFIFSANFEVDKKQICQDDIVEFSAKSDDAVSWFWDFGDGNSSTERNPQHQFQSAGIFDVQLIAENNSGCADTVLMQQYIEVTPYKADFKLAESIESNCVPVQVSFQDLSDGAESYFWDFGDGQTSRVANPVHLYNSVGNFDVSLVITNKLGCQDTLTKEQFVNVSGPQTAFEIEEKTVCLPNTANFTDVSSSAVKWTWIFGDGNTSHEQNPQHFYEKAGVYDVTLVAENVEGCEQTFRMKGIKVLPTPKVDFDMEISGECYPVEVRLTNKSSNLLKASYFWEFGDGQSSTEKDPTVLIEKTGTFNVTLTVKNDKGCPVSYTHANQILVRDTVRHIEADLNQILVENNNVQFELKPFSFNNISHYNVYRDSPTGFHLLQKIDLSGSVNQRIMYDDKSCRPQEMSHEYIFQAVSFCADTLEKEHLTVFNTMFLHSESQENNQRYIEWNSSKGFQVDNQRIFRKLKGEEQWHEIAVLEDNALRFLDQEDLCPGIYEYRVGAFEQNSLRSISNYVEFEVTDEIYVNQVAEIKNTTVMETGEVFTEWSIPEEGRGRITSFEIYRSENGEDFEYFDTVEPHEQFYIDEESDTENHTYTYQVKVINDCSIDTESSEESNTVLLQKDVQFRKYELRWNAFKGWEEGVKKYVIQRLNENGEWETVEEVSGDKLKTIIRDTKD
ncbi:PKD domain-containing protein [Marivirga harenae]|uniref:PKD domain-containing protein n=1 Tax=Marivirga harenae TaxID=2010992 RepID=UPI0026DF592A|nr:PKD domain-containing protein [Marivirga harenae]WKV11889.1 PKD domain-containing protein [Marivirga harenae]